MRRTAWTIAGSLLGACLLLPATSMAKRPGPPPPNTRPIVFERSTAPQHEPQGLFAVTDLTQITTPSQLTTSGADPSLSPDGAHLAYADNNQLVIANADGSSPKTYPETSPAGQPAWSPDGTQIAFACGGDLCIASVKRPRGVVGAQHVNVTDLTTSSSPTGAHPTWSPDGTKLAFSSNRSGAPRIWVINADGTGEVQLSGDVSGSTGQQDFEPDWSSTHMIAFSRFLTGDPWTDGYDIVTMSDTGGPVTNLTIESVNNDLYDNNPSWSPDGSKIAYDSLHDDLSVPDGSAFDRVEEIYVMDANGANKTRLTNNLVHDSDPDW